MKTKELIKSILPVNIRDALRLAGIFISCVAILSLLLTATEMIPKSALRKNMTVSAEYLANGDLFREKIKGFHPSRIDWYADSILLGIAWQTDPKHPVIATMLGCYYHNPLQNENTNLLAAVRDDLDANQEYIRYWHGSLILVRPLLILMDISSIYVLMYILLFGLLAALLWVLYHKGGVLPTAAVGLSFIIVCGWFVPLSLEYVWMFLLAFFASFPAIAFGQKGWSFQCEALFLITGIIAAFFDFLTTETLTLTLPLLLFLYMKKYTNDPTDSRICVIKAGLLWGIGYVGMWTSKWILSTIVLRQTVLPYITGHVAERIGGNIYDVTLGESFFKALYFNINTLLPYTLGRIGAIISIMICIAAVVFCFTHRKTGADRAYLFACAMVALIPYVRFLVLRNHSFLHFFFTYRAQMSAVIAVIFIIAELTGYDRKETKA